MLIEQNNFILGLRRNPEIPEDASDQKVDHIGISETPADLGDPFLFTDSIMQPTAGPVRTNKNKESISKFRDYLT